MTGQMIIKGSTVKTASFTVKMATIHTDSSQRDAQFDGRIMDVATYPDGTFALTRPIALAPLPATGTIKTYTATGRLTLHGRTRPVTFPLKAERTANGIEVQGSIPVLFSKWGIPNPSFTGFVTTQNHGIMELSCSTTGPPDAQTAAPPAGWLGGLTAGPGWRPWLAGPSAATSAPAHRRSPLPPVRRISQGPPRPAAGFSPSPAPASPAPARLRSPASRLGEQ